MSDEEIPEAQPKSDLDPDRELEVEGGTLVWRDPVASGEPLTGAYIWPALILLGFVAAIFLILT